MNYAVSADGTRIAYHQIGSGRPVVVVAGALSTAASGRPLAEAFAAAGLQGVCWDRRGRADSGDTAPYAPEREVDDLRAVVDAVGGDAVVLGHSAGAVLALLSAGAGVPMTHLFLSEPILRFGDDEPPADLAERLQALVDQGRLADAIVTFQRENVRLTEAMIEQLVQSPDFAELLPLAQTTVYDTQLIASVSTPTPAMLGISIPTTVLRGEPAAPVLVAACDRLVAAMPGAELVVVPESRDHAVDPTGTVREVLARLDRQAQASAEVLRAVSRDPLLVAATGGNDPLGAFLRHAVLLYGPADGPDRWATARRVLAEHPGLPTENVYAAAALADHQALARHLSQDSDAVNRPGGPFDWPPLLYLCYSRVCDELTLTDAERTLQILLDRGADPNAGFLWQGQFPPFTALTGLFGGGEQGETAQPVHPYAIPLARRLLEAGADPNDGQTLYNRMFTESDDHLELLFAYGLGRGDGGPWRRRLSDRLDAQEAMVRPLLTWAITHGQLQRIRLLAEHGVDLSAPLASPWLPTASNGNQPPTPVELASRSGRDDVAELLVQLGAAAPAADPESQLIGALLRGDASEVDRLVRPEPQRLDDLRRSRPSLVLRAAVLGRPDAVRLLVRHRFDVDARGRHDLPVEQPWETALHHAAGEGDVVLTELLLSLGAATDVLDARFQATPLGWARHFGQVETAALLERVSGGSGRAE